MVFEERWKNLRLCKLSATGYNAKYSEIRYNWIF